MQGNEIASLSGGSCTVGRGLGNNHGTDSNGLAMRPVERAPVEVHDGLEVKLVSMHAVDDRVRKAMEVELAVVSAEFAPAPRLAQDPVQRGRHYAASLFFFFLP